ncbi:MAG: heavy metal translocating P-type ATPase [Schwartzia succinivorans]|uniref:heavy metal translocating P-type ATPase n=1 Tax=Schwartzia succinivorans TaxID=55507 RepID=UPI00235213D6|nr:heavy metal translocating P-type ATPase [Schwartzia succinivorans]MBE6097407.1 heavy metal translocating P-type ATPase [Schwartzia succinivorans]
MNYRLVSVPLASELSHEARLLAGARLRAARGVVSAAADGKTLRVWYRGMRLSDAAMRQIQRIREKTEERVSEPKMEDYRRDALISLGVFAAMKLLEKNAPGAYVGLRFLRSILVLGMARGLFKSGYGGLIRDRRPNADTLTATAVAASVLSGRPESSLSLLTLSNVAEMLTSYAAERARRQISGLLNLNQRFVWLVDGGVERKVPVESLKAGDMIAAHSGEMICIDGRVLEGSAAVNQSSITGESNPAMKQEKSRVYAGSVVEAGELTILVEKVGKDTSLAHIVHLVEEAQAQRAPVQNFADQMANLLVPVSLLGAVVVYGATRDWQRVLNLLFIDFSCGLKLSTATAISAAIAAAAKKGILVKGGNYIEALAEADTLVLDKTGTLTVGVPQISFIRTVEGVSEKETVLLAASAEMHSVHPLAVAIQKYVREKAWEVPQHKSSETIVARGMKASVPDFDGFKGGSVLVGSRKFMEESKVKKLDDITIEDKSPNRIYVARDKKLLGVIGINDPIRPKMKKTLNQMRRHGIDEIVMLTGDSKEVAAQVAQDMDIDSFYAEVLPEDKANYVQKLKERGCIMMVGDGINDAPALAFANVGVSLGGQQTDIAAESGAVTIRSEDPEGLMTALSIGRRTMSLIRQNFTATITVNSAAMLLGALGKINPLWAAIIHNTATLAVVLNSARILGSGKKKFLPHIGLF